MPKDGGLLCVMNDIAPACDWRDYEAWYQQDHVPDRLSIPGFLSARRYRRLHGPRAEFLTIYETATPQVLCSAPYLKRLAEPTDWTARIMAHFRTMSRSICRVSLDEGQAGAGGLLALIAHQAAPEVALESQLAATLAQPGVTRVRLWRADPSVTVPSPEEKLRPGGDASFATIMVVEGTNAEMIQAALQTANITDATSFYSLIYASPEKHLKESPA
ncbi:MAG: hypothetical protein INF75_09125 [Roseomonas sp.]|nr:hypothetical protein [Roseomonas sp.]MCA3457932.1 hypothetical protein [Rhodobacter sp.]MCA3325979.1 hypothetical protein [Roseomonas sp.]MCA3332149.1 hypothetical protein [Roseomonas sp.]MCA3335380.1 hypothetical protein [Roseomonas sp.]